MPSGLWAIIAEHRPDLIHVHGSESFLGLALAGTSIPRVISLQGIVHAYLPHVADWATPADWIKVSATRQTLRGYGAIGAVRSYRERARVKLEIMTFCDAYLGRTDWDRAVLRSVRPDARYYDCGEILAAPSVTRSPGRIPAPMPRSSARPAHPCSRAWRLSSTHS